MTITDKLKELGYATVSESFYAKIQEWKSWHEGDVKGFHRYRVRNGAGMVRCKRYTLNMGKKVPEDWANLLMNERVEITLEGAKEQAFVDQVLEENNFAVKANEMQELAFALGTVAFVPRVVGMKVTEGGAIAGSAEGIISRPWRTSCPSFGSSNTYPSRCPRRSPSRRRPAARAWYG